MDIKDLLDKKPFYIFPELLPYLCNDLLPGLNELLGYAEQLHIKPNDQYGLTSRIDALRGDLTNALAGVHAGETA